uniref:GRB2 related adaptor protein b n=1 Tax=Mola mola TaxID=94237 RepID=A0A3Q3W069_MOLML
MEAVALFSFTASEADEISFQKGDIIKVTEMDDDSCWVTAEIEGKRGYVPENYISLLPFPWFAGRVSRLEAEKRLCWQDPGVFLVRESESAPGEFSVSVRNLAWLAPSVTTPLRRQRACASCLVTSSTCWTARARGPGESAVEAAAPLRPYQIKGHHGRITDSQFVMSHLSYPVTELLMKQFQ